MKWHKVVVTAGELSTIALMVMLAGCSSDSQPTTVAPPTVATTSNNSPAAPTTHSLVENGEKKTTEEERTLYLTAGGKYTESDIKANGGVTATQKFRGVPSSHDMFPKVGDRICPVTNTKANPEFSWIVAGKSYEFCCPPCIDEFVTKAKERQEELKAPDDYIKSK